MRVWLTAFAMIGVFVADQATKRVIELQLEPHSSVPVSGNFNIVLFYNRGVSFGLLSSESPYSPYVLALIGLVATIGFAVWAFRTESPLQKAALALIVGGAASNVVDRLDDGAVTDFLDFYIGALHWPAFNLADSAIVCGVGALLLESFFPVAVKAKGPAR